MLVLSMCEQDNYSLCRIGINLIKEELEKEACFFWPPNQIAQIFIRDTKLVRETCLSVIICQSCVV